MGQAIEPPGGRSEVTVGIFDEAERMVSAIQGALDVAEHDIDSPRPVDIAGGTTTSLEGGGGHRYHPGLPIRSGAKSAHHDEKIHYSRQNLPCLTGQARWSIISFQWRRPLQVLCLYFQPQLAPSRNGGKRQTASAANLRTICLKLFKISKPGCKKNCYSKPFWR